MSECRPLFGKRFGDILIEARDFPQKAAELGVRWISATEFIANSKILAIRMNLKRNTVCCDFRSHGFQTRSARNSRAFLEDLPDRTNWKLHTHSNMTRDSIETVVPHLPWTRPMRTRNVDPPIVDANPFPPDETGIAAVAGYFESEVGLGDVFHWTEPSLDPWSLEGSMFNGDDDWQF
jgi:hypothetical protein